MFFKRRYRQTAYHEAVLGTSCQIDVTATSRRATACAESAVLAEIDRLEAIFSAYAPDSQLMQWQRTSQEDIPVSPELAEVLESAELWRIRTRGTFNPATEALTRIWAEHALLDTYPNEAALNRFIGQINDTLWTVDIPRQTARRNTQLPVTLNAIAKGYIIDRAAACAFACRGVSEVMVNIGGDIRHRGEEPVSVGITNPFLDAENTPPVEEVCIQNQGLATSGNYRRGFSIGGQWHSHVLDPGTGQPVEHLVSVSVFAPDTATADVLATAFCVLDDHQSIALADDLGDIGVLLIDSHGKHTSNLLWKQQSIFIPPVG